MLFVKEVKFGVFPHSFYQSIHKVLPDLNDNSFFKAYKTDVLGKMFIVLTTGTQTRQSAYK